MTHRHVQAPAVAELALESRLPPQGPRPMMAPSVAQDQKLRRLGVCDAPDLRPPLRNRRHDKLGSVRRGSHIYGAVVAPRGVDPIRDCACKRLTREVMDIPLNRLLTPQLSSVREIPNQLLLPCCP
jgi:hypothetical protein